jgi:uncharacterized membrane protein required for colicin V production
MVGEKASWRMNVVDFGILVVIGLFAVGGLTRGLLLGLVDLVLLGLAVIVGARGSTSVAAPLVDGGFPPQVAAGAGFFVAFFLTLAITGFAARILLTPLRGLGGGSVLGWINSALGMVAGAVRGLALVFLALLAVLALPPELGYRPALAGSRLVAPIVETGRLILDSGLTWADIERDDLDLPLGRPVGDGVIE